MYTAQLPGMEHVTGYVYVWYTVPGVLHNMH